MIDRLAGEPGWRTIGVSRRNPAPREGVDHLPLDLTDRAACKAAAGALREVTHIFWAPRTPAQNAAAEAEQNLAMLRNLVEAADAAAPGLAHVHLVHGTKWYGSFFGPYRTPTREDDPRHMPPNFYYDQQDWIEAYSRGRRWGWSASRPHLVCGFAVGYPHNMMAVIAVYAAISRELGLPLRYPGSRAGFETVSMATDAGLLADAMLWAATEPKAAGHAFNVVNADYFRWCNVWPALARFFDMEAGDVQTIRLAEFMADKEPVWQRIVAKHGLQPNPVSAVADWKYGDGLLSAGWDDMSSTVKLRRFGFQRVVETEEMMLEVLGAYRAARVIP